MARRFHSHYQIGCSTAMVSCFPGVLRAVGMVEGGSLGSWDGGSPHILYTPAGLTGYLRP